MIQNKKTTFPNLPGTKLKELDIPVPSLTEQLRIVAYLDSLEKRFDDLKKLQIETEREIEKRARIDLASKDYNAFRKEYGWTDVVQA